MKSEISVHELKEILDTDKTKSITLLDVRTKIEHEEKHIDGSINIPLDQLDNNLNQLKDKDFVFVHCRTGGRSQSACQKLAKLKNTKVINIRGGILAWEEEGFTVNEKKGFHIPLMRQVQIVAGSLIIFGTIMSALVSTYWLFLTGFVGAGLTFAGITGWCGMAQLLAKMPWNKTKTII